MNSEVIYGFYTIVVILYCFSYLLKTKFDNVFLIIILTISFMQGGLAILGIAGQNNINLFVELLIYLLFISTLLKTKTFRYKGLFSILILLVFSMFASFLINNTNIVLFIQFIRLYFVVFIILWCAIHLNTNFKNIKSLLVFIRSMFVLQLISGLYKLLILGQMEPYIGTMSILGGSLTTAFAMVFFCFLLSEYLFDEISLKKLILILCFLLIFVIAGEKRVIFIYLPLLSFFGYFVFKRMEKPPKLYYNFKNIFILTVISAIIIFTVIVFNPTLNKEKKLGGSFDLEFVNVYISEYLSLDGKNNNYDPRSRTDAPLMIYNLFSNKDIKYLLFGFGPGFIEKNILTATNNYEKISSNDEILYAKYGISYGARTGFLWLGLQIGLVGMTIYLVFFYKLYKHIKINYSITKVIDNKVKMGIIIAVIALAIDFFTYSKVLISNNPVSLTLFLLIGLSLNKNENE